MKNAYIIKRNFEFQEIITNQNVVKNKSYIVYIRKKQENHLRYGISVGKKMGNAVKRNIIKRQIRNIVYSVLDKFKDKNWDLIIIARNFYKQNSYEDNRIQLDRLLSIIK